MTYVFNIKCFFIYGLSKGTVKYLSAVISDGVNVSESVQPDMTVDIKYGVHIPAGAESYIMTGVDPAPENVRSILGNVLG